MNVFLFIILKYYEIVDLFSMWSLIGFSFVDNNISNP